MTAPYINEEGYLTYPANGEAEWPFLFAEHRRELEASSVTPAVAAERKYQSVGRPTPGDDQSRRRLRNLGIPQWAIKEDRFFPGLLIPMYSPTGQPISYQWKPRVPIPGDDGKARKYASPRGQTNRLDVHPANRDRIIDPTVPLWITEGIKKADSLTSRGVCVIALTGVFNWRSTLGTLGDWEDVPLKGREVVICFDADARTNRNVLRAMHRLGKWLQYKGAKQVNYLITPDEANGIAIKGIDDYFAAGGSLDQLTMTHEPPPIKSDKGEFSDAYLAETIADDVLTGQYCWCSGLGWLEWDGRRWAECSDATVTEVARKWAVDQFKQAIADGHTSVDDSVFAGWRSVLGKGRMTAIVTLARGIVEKKAADFDADPDLLNTPGGVVDLSTGQTTPHDPDLLMTRITSGSYRPGFSHPDWDQALEALDEPEREWLQVRIGQGITGHRAPDGVNVILQGAGENGKSLLSTDGVVPAMGDYATLASHKLLADTNEHSEEQATLRGKRLLIAEEMTEERALNVAAIKRISDVGVITARHVHQRNMTFKATHTLFATTNYVPIVNETDHGTWRRLALLRFPYTFRKEGERLHRDTDRKGDSQLKRRIEANLDGQHDAIVTWAVDGALRWYKDPARSLLPPEAVQASTRAWRAQADRILGFWEECLIVDGEACILTEELLAAFNRWLENNGHKAWARETFTPRFRQHSETNRHGVEDRRIRNPENVSRWTGIAFTSARPLRAQETVWLGVRFKTSFDQEEREDGGNAVQPVQSENQIPHTRPEPEQVTLTSARSAQGTLDDAKQHLCDGCGESLQPYYIKIGRTRHPRCAPPDHLAARRALRGRTEETP